MQEQQGELLLQPQLLAEIYHRKDIVGNSNRGKFSCKDFTVELA
ncbi:hypothetical protein QUF75_04155 [Desulfococcaceae bacterium HSG7]|nr:hypothetical protein [Desulfococcaceae bacterium HSG7]